MLRFPAQSQRPPAAEPPNWSAGLPLDRLHVGVGEAEVMADLMHENMGHDGAGSGSSPSHQKSSRGRR